MLSEKLPRCLAFPAPAKPLVGSKGEGRLIILEDKNQAAHPPTPCQGLGLGFLRKKKKQLRALFVPSPA